MRCCEKCFDDEHIKHFIVDDNNKGDCDYCGSLGVFVADTSEVGQFIREGLNRAYENVDDSGVYWDSEEKVYTEGEHACDLLIDTHCITTVRLIVE